MTGRRVLAAAGLLLIAVGAWSVLAHLAGRLPALVLWLALPLAVHDFALVPLTLGLAWLVRRRLPRVWWGPVVVGAVTSAGLVLLAGVARLSPAGGAVPGLLDRDYGRGLLIALALTWAGVAVVGLSAVHSDRGER